MVRSRFISHCTIILFALFICNFVFSGALPAASSGSEFGVWTKDLDAAKNLAASVNNYFIIYYGSSSCGYCTSAQKAVFNTPQFYDWAKTNKVPLVYANYSASPVWSTIIRLHYIPATVSILFPTIIFVDGKSNMRITYFSFRNKDFDDFLDLAPAPRGCVPSEEICDGKDNDCDGEIDEDLTNSTECSQLGECAGAIKTCSLGQWSSCSKQPTQEICDGKDNDCDGTIDEGFDCVKGTINCNTNCTFATQTVLQCTGAIPLNGEVNYGTTGGKFTQTWNGTAWAPSSKTNIYNETPGECAWKCKTGYFYYQGECRADAQQATCAGTMPENAQWNDYGRNGRYHQIYSGGSWNPNNLSTNYNETPGDCTWKCNSNYHYLDGTCILSSKNSPCDLSDYNNSLPPNAKWNDEGKNGYFNQTWNNNIWTPVEKKALYSESTSECSFNCINQSKSCLLDKTIYCGEGVQLCDYGYWGLCLIGNAMACSINQYCDGTSCQFCENETKNCDKNLLNGCESNILSDNTNCGECGNSCEAGFDCVLGICLSTTLVQPTELCENIVCQSNEICDNNTGNCVCEEGYFNCDDLFSNGCEKDSPCEESPEQTQPECMESVDCDYDQACISRECVPVVCNNGFINSDHACICEKTLCDEICYSEEGVCCEDYWNTGITSCNLDLNNITQIVSESKNLEAKNFLELAENSLSKGQIMKSKAEASLAELRAKIKLAGDSPELLEEYDQIKLALTNANYDEVETLVIQTNNKIDSEKEDSFNLFIPFLIVGIIIISLILVFLVIKSKSKPVNPPNTQNTDETISKTDSTNQME